MNTTPQLQQAPQLGQYVLPQTFQTQYQTQGPSQIQQQPYATQVGQPQYQFQTQPQVGQVQPQRQAYVPGDQSMPRQQMPQAPPGMPTFGTTATAPQLQYNPQFWHPQNQTMPGWSGQLPQMPQPQAYASGPAVPSLSQQVLSDANPQRVQDFMTALNQVGAGGNNAQMTSQPMQSRQPQQLLGAPAAWTGNAGQAGYFGGFGNPQQGTNYMGGAVTAPAGAKKMPDGGLGGAFGTAGAVTMSDERQKEEIRPARRDVAEFLNAIGAWKYEYKNPAHGVGEFVSPMAQELEKTKLGRSAVVDTPEGKMVQYGRLGGITLAAAAMLNDRIGRLERKLEKLGK